MSDDLKINLLFRKPVYGTSHPYELTRLGQAISGLDIPMRAIFENEGIFCLIKDQNPKGMQFVDMNDMLTKLAQYEAEFFVIDEALKEFGITIDNFIPSIDINVIPRSELGNFLLDAKFTFEI